MIPTANISDALDLLGINGQVQAVRALVPGARCAGPAYTVRFAPVDVPADAPAANYLEAVPEGAVVVIDNAGRLDCTVWGGLMAAFATQRRVAGTVIWGVCRDLVEIRALGYPMFARRPYMRTGKGRVRCVGVGEVAQLGDVAVAPGDWIVADDDGVVCVPAAHQGAVLSRAQAVAEVEERILADVRAGVDLATARQRHRYDQLRLGGRSGEGRRKQDP
ncbi:MAG: RraA family protein [Alphaproteobacteria bacterium]|nr:RraA family protein [Alphaproteobacteria bacterium]